MIRFQGPAQASTPPQGISGYLCYTLSPCPETPPNTERPKLGVQLWEGPDLPGLIAFWACYEKTEVAWASDQKAVPCMQTVHRPCPQGKGMRSYELLQGWPGAVD